MTHPPHSTGPRDGWLILVGVLGFISVPLWPLMYFGSARGAQRIYPSPVWLASDSAMLSGLTKVGEVVSLSTPAELVPLLLAVPCVVIAMSLAYGVLLMTKSQARLGATDLAGMTAWWGIAAYSATSLAVTAEGPDAFKEPTLVLIPWVLPGLVSIIALARVIRHEWAGLSLLGQRAVFTALAVPCGLVLLVINLRVISLEPVGVIVHVAVYIGVPVLATLLRGRRAACRLLASWALAAAAKLVCDSMVLEHLSAYGYISRSASGVTEVSMSIDTLVVPGFVASVTAVVLAVVLNIRLHGETASAEAGRSGRRVGDGAHDRYL
ncbi:hypothetical protein SK854_05865 [Lentzea sp. BCCO 10_0061]|uniref:Cytochrome c oxidase assembly protein n=1 Tax=Lentzea sokolovensis TaxID=3095429 RepID=A0ABU4UQ76_9PSEU|nr:hypothetical protein [Lentzea sp. BCCO 10_0061]MDX8141629.1 hypothetical protein [Lentzea sp. BCCO 10_0061]